MRDTFRETLDVNIRIDLRCVPSVLPLHFLSLFLLSSSLEFSLIIEILPNMLFWSQFGLFHSRLLFLSLLLFRALFRYFLASSGEHGELLQSRDLIHRVDFGLSLLSLLLSWFGIPDNLNPVRRVNSLLIHHTFNIYFNRAVIRDLLQTLFPGFFIEIRFLEKITSPLYSLFHIIYTPD